MTIDNPMKEYIGDGVYVEYERDTYSVILTTENGLRETNRIVLEADVLDNLNHFLRKAFQSNQLGREKK